MSCSFQAGRKKHQFTGFREKPVNVLIHNPELCRNVSVGGSEINNTERHSYFHTHLKICQNIPGRLTQDTTRMRMDPLLLGTKHDHMCKNNY